MGKQTWQNGHAGRRLRWPAETGLWLATLAILVNILAGTVFAPAAAGPASAGNAIEICTAGGLRVIATDGIGATQTPQATCPDCPLCPAGTAALPMAAGTTQAFSAPARMHGPWPPTRPAPAPSRFTERPASSRAPPALVP